MPNTPKKPPKKPEGKGGLNPLTTRGLGRADMRHAEMLAVQEKIVQATKIISWATLVYAIAAVAMLVWSVAQFLLA